MLLGNQVEKKIAKAIVKRRYTYNVRNINVGFFTWACSQTARTLDIINSEAMIAIDLKLAITIGHNLPSGDKT